MKNFVYEFRVRRYRRALSARCAEAVGARADRPSTVAALLQQITVGADRESFYAFFLDINNTVIGFEHVAVGTLTGVDVHPREVFRGALLSGAAAIVLGHNHPSGKVTASKEDMALTARMLEVGELLGIPVLDHVIVGSDTSDFYSTAERGLHASSAT
jgi:DNA repair protein RadC